MAIEDFLIQCVARYMEVPGSKPMIKAWTPYLPDLPDKGPRRRAINVDEKDVVCDYCAYVQGWQEKLELEQPRR